MLVCCYTLLCLVMATSKAGYECEFVEKPPKAFQTQCPVCLLILREPFQADCCGYVFCQECIQKIEQDNRPCPCCNSKSFVAFEDKGRKRSLYGFRVYCPNKLQGCQWMGELGELDNHLNFNPEEQNKLNRCQLTQRSNIQVHQYKQCPWRPFSCEYCMNYTSTYEDVTVNHWLQCGDYPLECPNRCGFIFPRHDIVSHMSKSCPLAIIDCEYRDVGCEVRLLRKDKDIHMRDGKDNHLSLALTQNKQLKLQLAGKSIQIMGDKTLWHCSNSSFIDRQVIKFHSLGSHTFTFSEHDITVRIPAGAVSKHTDVHLELAVALNGPIMFPESTLPISPILWFCLMEKDVKLIKPLQITLPHFLSGINDKKFQYYGIGFAKAHHNGSAIPSIRQCSQVFTSVGNQSYGTIKLDHFCYLCIIAENKPEIKDDIGYCLTRVESRVSKLRHEAYFCLSYYLRTCMQAIKEQFPEKEVVQLKFSKCFKLSAPSIKFSIQATKDCSIALEPHVSEIWASDVDYTTKSNEEMQIMHETRVYPPRLKVTFHMHSPTASPIPVKISGSTTDDQLGVDLMLPFIATSSSDHTEDFAWKLHSESIQLDKKPVDVAAALKLMLPLASDWKTIGALLSIQCDMLKKIEADEDRVNNRLLAVLNEWLKQVNPAPSWAMLADAVRPFNESIAKKLLDENVCLY